MLAVPVMSHAQAPGIDVININRNGSDINVVLDVDVSQYKQKGDRLTVFTPMLVNGPDTARFQSFTVAGRNMWYKQVRDGLENPYLLKGFGDFKNDNSVKRLDLSTGWRSWMDNSTLIINAEDRCCGDNVKGVNGYALAEMDFSPQAFMPDFVYVTPVAEVVKSREVKGRAFIDFKVNQTVILPDYRKNSIELAKIIATIDSVKNDKDITVTSLSIAGTASPEGPYNNNVRLAKGRTEALKNYVQTLYKFPANFIKTSWMAEDWPGLRVWVAGSNIENKEGILAIIDSDLEPDAKNTKIQTTYPTQYKWLLDNIYPGLRHSDYNIEFNIKSYTNVDEIITIMRTAPQKLSLAELFMAANSQPEGSPLYNEAFEIAVTLFPSDETANLNAGIAALKRNDLQKARTYLNKSGNSDESLYAKAVLTAIEGNRPAALETLKKLAKKQGSPVAANAAAAAASLEAIVNGNGGTFKKY